MGTITKNYIIIILFEKIIMKKECQYCHHLKHHHHQHHHHPVWNCMVVGPHDGRASRISGGLLDFYIY
jgi:hypothetical protein